MRFIIIIIVNAPTRNLTRDNQVFLAHFPYALNAFWLIPTRFLQSRKRPHQESNLDVQRTPLSCAFIGGAEPRFCFRGGCNTIMRWGPKIKHFFAINNFSFISVQLRTYIPCNF